MRELTLYESELVYLSEFIFSSDDDDDGQEIDLCASWRNDFNPSFYLEEEEEEEEEEVTPIVIEKEESLTEKLENFRAQREYEIIQKQSIQLHQSESEDERFHIDILEKITERMCIEDLEAFLKTNQFIYKQRHSCLKRLKTIRLREIHHLANLRFGIYVLGGFQYDFYIDARRFSYDKWEDPEKIRSSICNRNLIEFGDNITSIEISVTSIHPLVYLTTTYKLSGIKLLILFYGNVPLVEEEQEWREKLLKSTTCLYFYGYNKNRVLINEAKSTEIKFI